MVILFNNKNIDNIFSQFMGFHDFIFDKYEYDYKNKLITLYVKHKNEDYYLSFGNVMCVYMQSCEPWGKSPYIASINHVKESVFIDKLRKYILSEKYPLSQLETLNNAYAVIVEFVSGNSLTFVCNE